MQSTESPRVSFGAVRRLRPLRRREYDRLVELGAFRDEKVELLEGMLVPMSPQGSRHAYVIQELTALLVPAVAGRGRVRVQLPFAGSDVSEPEPDIAVVPPGDYSAEHPDRALLVVEVADSSLADDLDLKAPAYAAAGVPELWVIDCTSQSVIVHRRPMGRGWGEVIRHGRDASLAMEALPDVAVRVATLFPR